MNIQDFYRSDNWSMKGAEWWAQKTNIWTTTDEDSELICPWNGQQLAVYFII